ncbi:MAG: 2OG-Fe(II) oxygenase [Aquabacterium sp.]
MLVNFSSELGDWIQHNLARGCGVDALVDSMVAQRFEPHVARGLATAFWRAHTEGRPQPQEAVSIDDAPQQPYVYETPRLAPGAVIHANDRDVPVLMRLERPMLAVLDGVLSTDECAQLIALARPRLRPSTIVDPVTGEDTVTHNRDSEGMFFKLCETPFIARLDQRISEIMNCPLEHGEGLQVLRYGPQAKNTPHFDFLVPSHAANRASLARSGQRVSTMVIYLNEVADGGETVFPEVGLAVAPKRGNAVYFEYANSRGQVDLASVHAGAPVHQGEKWAVTKWVRERRFVPA